MSQLSYPRCDSACPLVLTARGNHRPGLPLLWGALIVALLLSFGCSGFKAVHLDATRDIAATDLPIDQHSPGEAGQEQALDQTAPDSSGPIPLDYECTEPWTKTNKTDQQCAPRTVITVRKGVFQADTLAITRTKSGRVGILYNTYSYADQASLITAHFTDGQPIQQKEITKTDYDRVGVAGDITADEDGAFHLAYLSATISGNELVYRQLVPGSAFTPEEPIEPAFSPQAELSLGVAANGTVYLVYANPAGNILQGVHRSPGTGQWSAPSKVMSSFESTVAGAWQVDLVMDDNGLPHVATNVPVGYSSLPKYTYFDGTEWVMSKSVDNNALQTTAGWSVQLALGGAKRYVSYISFAGDTAELRLGRWSLSSDTPEISIIEKNLTLDRTHPFFRSAMAIDRHGLLHLALLSPFTSTEGRLEYWRQYPVNNELIWLKDVVDDLAMTTQDSLRVDLLVDDQDRPHIAYLCGPKSEIHYATRSDR